MTDPIVEVAEVADPDVTDLVTVTLIHDVGLGSPPNLASYGGRVVAIPPARIPLPKRGTLFGLRGFSRQQSVVVDGENVMQWQWVLQGDTDPVDAFVDGLTGLGSWKVPQSRTVVKTMIQRMFSAGIPRGTITTQVPQFYAAVAAEIRAQDASGP